MSLNWDVSGVQWDKKWLPYEKYFGDVEPRLGYDVNESYLNPITEAIVWATLTVGLGAITEDNWMEFYMRYCAVCGILRQEPSFTALDVKRHIGLTTNVTSIKTTKQWLREAFFHHMDNAKRWVNTTNVCMHCNNTADAIVHKESYRKQNVPGAHKFKKAPAEVNN